MFPIVASVGWPEAVTSIIAVAAIVLSVVSLLIQRKRPYLEAQFLSADGVSAVSIRNSGERTARAPWVMVVAKAGDFHFCTHAGNGFLPPKSGRLLITAVPFPATTHVVGVVGYIDRKGRHVVHGFGGSNRHRRFTDGAIFEECFRAFYPRQALGPQAAKVSDRPLD